MIAAPLIDENRRNYSLKEIAQEYVGETKSEAGLYEAAKDFGVDAKAEMHLLPLCMLVLMLNKMLQLL